MQGRIFLTHSSNDKMVYYDPVDSHTATHFSDTPQLQGLVKIIIQKTNLEGEFILFDFDFGRVVGNSDLIKNDPGDEIVYAKRKNRDVYSSFNKSKAPMPSTKVSVGFEQRDVNTYELVSAWIGPSDSPPFPGDERETVESKPFWMSHSLAWGTQEIQTGTETSVCPW